MVNVVVQETVVLSQQPQTVCPTKTLVTTVGVPRLVSKSLCALFSILAWNHPNPRTWVCAMCATGFIGDGDFALYSTQTQNPQHPYELWMWQWSFCAVSTTILSGSIAERATFGSYIIYALFYTGEILYCSRTSNTFQRLMISWLQASCIWEGYVTSWLDYVHVHGVLQGLLMFFVNCTAPTLMLWVCLGRKSRKLLHLST